MSFNPTSHIKKFDRSVEKLMSVLSKNGITFLPTDGEMPNVIFTRGEEVMKISHHCFYRFSGLACVYIHHETSVDILEVTDDMWINQYMKPCIELNFGLLTIPTQTKKTTV